MGLRMKRTSPPSQQAEYKEVKSAEWDALSYVKAGVRRIFQGPVPLSPVGLNPSVTEGLETGNKLSQT